MSRGAAVLYNANGEIVGVRSGATDNIQIDITNNEGRGIFVDPDNVPEDLDDYYVSDSAILTLKGASPHETAIFDYATKQWVYDLVRHAADKWAKIKAARNAEEFGTFVWNNHTFDCDEVSQRRIQGAVQLAALDTNTVMDWTIADNTVQTFNATELQQIGQSLAGHVNACHVKARGLRDQINAAESEAELSVISW